MSGSREIAFTTDTYAYDEDEINSYAILNEYSTTNDYIVYQYDSGAEPTPAFKSVRVLSFDDAANRDVIVEESIDQVAAASLFAGTDGISGKFEAAFRGWDFHLCGLMKGIMGAQTPSNTSASSNVRKAGVKYTLGMTAQPLAIKIVDEQATDTTGSNNVSGTTTIHRGVGITSMELSLQVKDYAKATINWIGRRSEVYDIPVNSSTTVNGDPAIFYNASIIWTPYTGSYGTAETIKCKGFTMNLSRQMDQDYFYVGSEFLQGLYYNGLTDLGGQITLGAGDWQRIRTMMSGATTGSATKTLDQGNKEFFGTRADNNVLANAIPAGRFTVVLHNPTGTYEVTKIVCDMAKLTEMSRSVQGRNQFQKTVTWKAQINATDTFYIEVYQP